MVLSHLKEQFLLKITAIAIVWSLLIQAFATNIEAFPFYIQFVLTNVVFYGLFGLALGRYIDGETLFNKKVLGGVFLAMAFDVLAPPLAVGLDGTLNATALLSNGSIDVFLYHVWSFVPVGGFVNFLLVYPVSFLLLNLAAAMALSGKDLASHLK